MNSGRIITLYYYIVKIFAGLPVISLVGELTKQTPSANICPMLAIRLKRVGRTNDPSFRMIVQDHRRSPKKTRGVVEYVGSYDARKGVPQVNAERIKYWLSQGAQASETVHNILIDTKVITGKKVNALNTKTPIKSTQTGAVHCSQMAFAAEPLAIAVRYV